MSIINKKKLNELLALSNDPKIELLEENQKSYKIEINGDKDKVKFKDNGFSEKQLEQLQGLLNPIVQDIKEIKSRLDVLEKDVNVLKSFHKNDFNKLKSKNKK